MITITRKLGKDALEIVLDDYFGNESVALNGCIVSKGRSIRSSRHEFQLGAESYLVRLEASLMWGTITGIISRDGKVIDRFSENPFKLSGWQLIAFLIVAAGLPFVWFSVWHLAELPKGLPMILSLLVPFAIAMVFVRLMIVRNMKSKGFWRSRVKAKEP